MAVALLASGCGKFVRDELIGMQKEIDALYGKYEELNSRLDALRESVVRMAAGGFVTEVEETAFGDTAAFILHFGHVDSNGSFVPDPDPVILRTGVDGKDGADADPFVLTVKQDTTETPARWYWYDIQAEDWYKQYPKQAWSNKYSVVDMRYNNLIYCKKGGNK